MAYFHDLTYVCAPAPFQMGAAAGLEQLPPSFYTQLAADHQVQARADASRARRRGHGADRARRAPITFWPTRSVCPAKPPRKRRATCCAATGVAAVAGSAFFRPGRGENLLRFCFAKQDAELDEACARLRKL